MKIFTSALLVFALATTACGHKSAPEKTNEMNKQNSKTLVAYFSATGTTKAVAEKIALATQGDLYAIEPMVAYTDADLDWRDKKSRSTIEMTDAKSRPEMKDTPIDLALYDTVYVGFPIWWYVAPRIINTFMEKFDLTGKVIVPFATSGSSSIENCVVELRKQYPSLNIQDGKLLNGATQEMIDAWVK